MQPSRPPPRVDRSPGERPGFQIYGALLGPDPALQMARGLFGPLVVDEPTPPQIDLETIVLLSEWRLDAQGQIAPPSPAGNGERLILTAGGSPAPLQLTGPPGGRVRLRLGNCATARTLLVSIEGVKPLHRRRRRAAQRPLRAAAQPAARRRRRAVRADVRPASRWRRSAVPRPGRRSGGARRRSPHLFDVAPAAGGAFGDCRLP